jgi:hypothetical protein
VLEVAEGERAEVVSSLTGMARDCYVLPFLRKVNSNYLTPHNIPQHQHLSTT